MCYYLEYFNFILRNYIMIKFLMELVLFKYQNTIGAGMINYVKPFVEILFSDFKKMNG